MATRSDSQLQMRRPHLNGFPASRPLSPGYEIRAVDGDAGVEAGLASVLSAAFEDTWTVERVQKELTQSPKVLAVYFATFEGTPVATASSRYDEEKFPGSGYLHWVGTDPEHSGRGLGLALVLRVMEDFIERGYENAVLETDDFRIPAVKTYLRCGFVPELDVNDVDQRPRWSRVMQNVFS